MDRLLKIQSTKSRRPRTIREVFPEAETDLNKLGIIH
jgi:hypothetical protein